MNITIALLILCAALSTAALAAAMTAISRSREVAEQADECRKGDVLIWEDSIGGYTVTPSEADRPLIASRILSRAPRREPWADLAGVLGRYDLSAIECEGAGELARDLYADGVRVTGGDDRG